MDDVNFEEIFVDDCRYLTEIFLDLSENFISYSKFLNLENCRSKILTLIEENTQILLKRSDFLAINKIRKFINISSEDCVQGRIGIF